MNSRQLRKIATNPAAYREWLLHGRAPALIKPTSPLITLLEQITPHDRIAMRGVTVGPALGYSGVRTFATAEQALNWIRPQNLVAGDSFPADSWQDKRFRGPLTLGDLLACCASYPDRLRARLPSVADQHEAVDVADPETLLAERPRETGR